MPSNRQTAASRQGSGCLSGFLIPPMAVLLVGLLLTFFVRGLNTPVQAESLSPVTQANGLPTQSAALSSTSLSPIFTPEIHYWADSIIRWAAAEFNDLSVADAGVVDRNLRRQCDVETGPEPGSSCDADRILWGPACYFARRRDGTVPGHAVSLQSRRESLSARYQCPARTRVSQTLA